MMQMRTSFVQLLRMNAIKLHLDKSRGVAEERRHRQESTRHNCRKKRRRKTVKEATLAQPPPLRSGFLKLDTIPLSQLTRQTSET